MITNEYDKNGNLIHFCDTFDEIEFWREYDNDGNLTYQKDNNGSWQSYTYDKINRIVHCTLSNGTKFDSKMKCVIKENICMANLFNRGNKQVLKFIENFVLFQGEKNCEIIHDQFRNGYCYYFAYMLQVAFHRGTICVAYPFGHIVWVDEDDIPYDIEGINYSDCEYYIPISYFGDGYKDFARVPDDSFGASKEFIEECKDKYLKDINKL